MRSEFTLHYLDEHKPDGTVEPVWLGTKLKDGTKVLYTVSYGTLCYFRERAVKARPDSTFKTRAERG